MTWNNSCQLLGPQDTNKCPMPMPLWVIFSFRIWYTLICVFLCTLCTMFAQHHIKKRPITFALRVAASPQQRSALTKRLKKKVWHGWGVSLSQLIAHSPSHLSLCKKKRKKEEALGWWLIGQVRRLGKYAVSDSQWPLKQCDGTVGLKTLYWRRVENSLVWDSQRIFLWTVFAYSLPFFYVSLSLAHSLYTYSCSFSKISMVLLALHPL